MFWRNWKGSRIARHYSLLNGLQPPIFSSYVYTYIHYNYIYWYYLVSRVETYNSIADAPHTWNMPPNGRMPGLALPFSCRKSIPCNIHVWEKTSHSLVEIHENTPSTVPCDHLGKKNLPPRKIGNPSFGQKTMEKYKSI